ncbi:MAG TPA: polysaccharide deacetylase family protein [Bryobacteraceae bacterium]|nr:polysaccharide deacetylase family protein [Bryobacteraceae bacterium]
MILLYHRVSRLRRDPWRLCLTPEQFASQMSFLRENTDPISLTDLENAPRSRRRPAVAVTFDDGYDDNLIEAEPVLRHYGIPATIFVVSGMMTAGREFWWDDLERILLNPGDRPREEQIMIRGQPTILPRLSIPNELDDEGWCAWQGTPPSAAHRLYSDLHQALLPLSYLERDSILATMRDWAGVPPEARASHRPLDCAQLRQLVQSPAIDVGVHTVTHPNLAALPEREQRHEIVVARADIERITGQRSGLFSYPYGKREHFSERTVSIVRSEGFQCACANIPGRVRPHTDRLQLPRIVAPALGNAEFAHWFSHCLRDSE